MASKKAFCLVLAVIMGITICAPFTTASASTLSDTSMQENTTLVETDFIRDSSYIQDSSGAFVFTRNTRLPATRGAGCANFMQEQMAIIPLTEDDACSLAAEVSQIRAGAGGSQEKYTSLTGGVTIYSTVHYSTGDYNGRSTIWMTKLEGYYTINTSTVRVTSQSLTYGQCGMAPTSAYLQQRKETDLSNQSWTVYPPSSWKPIFNVDALTSLLGCYYEVSFLANSGSTGTVELSNNLSLSAMD